MDEHQKWRRGTGVVERVAPDRVLVRLVGGSGLDLLGVAALTWVALDEPRTAIGIASELAEIDTAITPGAVLAALDDLATAHLVEPAP